MNVVGLVPAYQEAGRIGSVVRGILAHLPVCIVVDDGSPDATAEEAEAAGARVARHPVNRGKGQALLTGFRCAAEAGADGAICLDGDGQHDPAEIPKFLALAESKRPDIILGTRSRSAAMPAIRRFTNRFCSEIVSRLAGTRIRDSQSGYRYVSLRAWRLARPKTASYDAESEFLIRAGRRGLSIHEVPITTTYGTETSKINPVTEPWRFLRLAACYTVGMD
ncbi:MAG TPA: glycosyltransferase family 2 protein [Phycisphaerae bacterium]|nr:glycosyltransferase family 2 protein [Phycisphaerae bacterium]